MLVLGPAVLPQKPQTQSPASSLYIRLLIRLSRPATSTTQQSFNHHATMTFWSNARVPTQHNSNILILIFTRDHVYYATLYFIASGQAPKIRLFEDLQVVVNVVRLDVLSQRVSRLEDLGAVEAGDASRILQMACLDVTHHVTFPANQHVFSQL